MGKGLFWGVIWGAVASVLGLSVVSILIPVDSAAPVPQPVIAAPDTDEDPAATPQPRTEAEPGPDEPQAADAEPAAETPDIPDAAPQEAAPQDTTAAEPAPQVDTTPPVAGLTAPLAEPAAPVIVGAAPDQPAAPEPETPVDPQETGAGGAPAPSAETDTALLAEPELPVAEPPRTPAAETAVLPNPQAMAPEAPEAEDSAAVALDTGEPAPEPAAPADTAPPEAATEAPPQPNATTSGQDSAEPAAPDAAAAPQTAAAGPSGPAIEVFAQPFDNPEARPIVAIVLMDAGASALPDAMLDELNVPVSFAVDASLPGAQDKMRRYRDAGFEVLAMPPLPQGATPGDLEVTLQASLDAVPEAVGVMDAPDTGFARQRTLTEQAVARLGETGHGLLVFGGGLGSAEQIARRDGVPAATVFRDFDAKGESERVITRFLDQAAFKARQEGVVVMVGRARPETVSAIMVWALRDRASSVAIAPISAALRLE